MFSDDPTGNQLKSNQDANAAPGAFNIETEELIRLNKQIDMDNSDDSLFQKIWRITKISVPSILCTMVFYL